MGQAGVSLKNITVGDLQSRLRSWFPEREFFMRSRGQVRFITITSRMQMAAAGMVLAIVAAWGVSMAAMAVSQFQARSVLDREARVASAESRVAAYRNDIEDTAADLERRQTFLEEMTDMLPADVIEDDTVTDSAGEAGRTVEKVSATVPEAAPLARLEARQLALVEKLTRFADRRAARAEEAIRELGLNPGAMLAAAQDAQGGPFHKPATERDGSLDPRFERLALSLARMDALERSLDGIPQVMPVKLNAISSGFGYRRDPFTGRAAMHSGLDFRGPVGAPIHAAAAGKVSFVGTKAGYGRLIEISHGNGLVTRYAHMSAWKARAGQEVEAGEVIGAIGNSGRSTGPHLHFEVRVNDRAVNPRPFLETARDVLEEARAHPASRGGKARD